MSLTVSSSTSPSQPITLSGFNGIDFSSVIQVLMQEAAQPEAALQTEQQNLQGQSANLSTLATNLSTLDSAAAALGVPGLLAGQSVTSTNPSALGFTAGSSTPLGTYNIVVQNLAQAQVTESTSTAPDTNSTIVATGGTLTIGGVGVTLSGSTTLQGLADAINGTANIGVTATVVQSGTSSYSLLLTGNQTGSANSFSITNDLTGGTGVTFGSTNASIAANAQILLNNVSITSSTNTFTNAVLGSTIQVYQADPSTTVSVTVSQSTSAAEQLINTFVSAYNSLVTFAQGQDSSANNNDTTSIGHDPTLQTVMSSLQQIMGSVNATGSPLYETLASVGIGFTETGQLTFDNSAFENAVNTGGASAVQTLFSGGGGTTGVFQSLDTTLQNDASSNGAVTAEQTADTTQVQNLTNQIAEFQARLQIQQTSLEQEYSAADQAMSSLNSQTSSLAPLLTQFTLY